MLNDIDINDTICSELENIRISRAILNEVVHYFDDKSKRSGLPAMGDHILLLLSATGDYLRSTTAGLEKLSAELCPPKPSTTDKAEDSGT